MIQVKLKFAFKSNCKLKSSLEFKIVVYQNIDCKRSSSDFVSNSQPAVPFLMHREMRAVRKAAQSVTENAEVIQKKAGLMSKVRSFAQAFSSSLPHGGSVVCQPCRPQSRLPLELDSKGARTLFKS